MYALIDCNNFYASCERLFRPDLHLKPIVVLSSGDGCVIARSNEAKALGIQMGEPYFKIKSLCQQKRVHIFSSNFALYRDLSQRVMSIIEDAWEEMEIYSVDEAFLDLSTLHPSLQEKFCADLQKFILKCTGIPVSIGMGKTKTLAKISNHIAKKILYQPVFNVTHQMEWLKKIDIGDVWGVGRQSREKLTRQNIYTAFDLTQIDLKKLRKKYNVVLARTAMELQGHSCYTLHHQDEPRKSILSSRSFGHMQTEFDALAQSVSMHCTSVYEKLRQDHLLTYSICVFLRTNRFREDLPQYSQYATKQFKIPTDDVRIMTHHAKECLREIYRPGFLYKKAGVYLSELVDNKSYQLDLFEVRDEAKDKKTKAFLHVFDHINHRFGKHTLRLGAVGFDQSWDTKFQFKSPAYTTRWSELPIVRT